MIKRLKVIGATGLQSLILILLILLTFQYISFYYISQNILPRFLLYIFYLLSVLLPFVLIKNVKLTIVPYRFAIIITYSVILIVSFFYLGDDFGQNVADFIIYSPIITGLFFYRFNIDFLQKAFKYISILALIMLPFALTANKIDLNDALKREYTESAIFFYAPLFWAVIPAVLLSILTSKNLLISIAYWVGAIVLNLIFLKRFIIVDSALLFVVIIVINSTKKKKVFNTLKMVIALAILISVVMYLKGDFILKLFDATTNRIETTSEDISAFDRFVETENYLNNATTTEIIFGKGFAGTQFGLGKEAQALHVGWTNFILKGGILLFLLILLPFFKLISMASNLGNYPLKIQFSFWFLIIYIVRLTYTNMHNLSPEMLIFFYAVYNIMDVRIPKRRFT